MSRLLTFLAVPTAAPDAVNVLGLLAYLAVS
jgi:hypothetical protein